MTVPAFRRAKPPKLQPAGAGAPRRELFRGSARERGYTTAWDNLRDDYARSHPFCEECLRRGYLICMAVVDHMKPVVDAGEDRLNPENLDSLCHDCHNGWKRRLETFARKTGQIDLLPVWVKHPDQRPSGFMIQRTGPVQQDGSFA